MITPAMYWDLFICGVISAEEFTDLNLGVDRAAPILERLERMNRDTLNAQLEWDLFDNFIVVDDCADTELKLAAIGVDVKFLDVEVISDDRLMVELDDLYEDFEHLTNLELDAIAAEEATERCVEQFAKRLSSR